MSEDKTKFVSNNLKVNLTVNMQTFKGMLSDFSEDEKTLTFTTDKSATSGNNVQYEILTRKNEKIEGTGKIHGVSLSTTFVNLMTIVVRYNQLSSENKKKLLEEFEMIQTDLSDYFNKINKVA